MQNTQHLFVLRLQLCVLLFQHLDEMASHLVLLGALLNVANLLIALNFQLRKSS